MEVSAVRADANPAFLSTGTLDTFNGANGSIGSAWAGAGSGYSISSYLLRIGGGNAVYWNTEFGADQDVYVTLRTNNASAREIDLLLKAQSAGCGSGAIEIPYEPIRRRAKVWTYASSQGWVRRGSDIPVTFQVSDVFGAAAKAYGTVTAFRDGVVLGSRNVSGWSTSGAET
jgi:hypothetical protein